MEIDNKKLTPLARIRDLLKAEECLVRFEPTLKGRPFERLYVGMYQDEYNVVCTLEMAFISDFAKVIRLKEAPSTKPRISLLHFYSEFQAGFRETSYKRDISLMLQNINVAMPLGHFGFSSSECFIFYQYVYPSSDPDTIPSEIILEIIDIAQNAMSRLSPLFDKLSARALSCADIVGIIQTEGLFR